MHLIFLAELKKSDIEKTILYALLIKKVPQWTELIKHVKTYHNIGCLWWFGEGVAVGHVWVVEVDWSGNVGASWYEGTVLHHDGLQVICVYPFVQIVR